MVVDASGQMRSESHTSKVSVNRKHVSLSLFARRSLGCFKGIYDANIWAYFNFGSILFLRAQAQTRPDFEPAIRHLRRALELSPQFPGASLQLGMVLQSQGKMDESIRILEQVVATAPE